MEINDAILYALCENERAERAKALQEATEDACSAILETLNDYPVEIWGAALGAAVAGLFKAKLTAQEMAEEERAVKNIKYGPGIYCKIIPTPSKFP